MAAADIPSPTSPRSSKSRWGIKLLVTLVAVTVVTSSGLNDAWPFVHWPMYAFGDYLPPSSAHRDELRVIDTQGHTHTLTSYQLLTLDDDSSQQVPGKTLISNAFDDDDSARSDRYKTYLIQRTEQLLGVNAVEIQLWRLTWDVDFTRYPFIELDHPQHAEMRDSFAVRYFDDAANPPPPPDQDTDLRFGDTLELLAHDLPTGTQIAPCRPLYLRTWWRAAANPPEDYQITAVLTDQQGIGQVQSDGALADSPTHQWQPNQEALDRRQFSIPCDLPPGKYNLLVALYKLDTLEHLPVANADGSPTGEYGYLTAIDIVESQS